MKKNHIISINHARLDGLGGVNPLRTMTVSFLSDPSVSGLSAWSVKYRYSSKAEFMNVQFTRFLGIIMRVLRLEVSVWIF
jgi:hypothetical protein